MVEKKVKICWTNFKLFTFIKCLKELIYISFIYLKEINNFCFFVVNETYLQVNVSLYTHVYLKSLQCKLNCNWFLKIVIKFCNVLFRLGNFKVFSVLGVTLVS